MPKRFLPLASLVVIALAAAACGSSSSGSSTSLSDGDVAVVNGQHITKDQLDAEIKLAESQIKGSGKAVPKTGTAAYKTTVIEPSLQQLVQNAEVEQLATKLKVSVSDADIASAQSNLVAQNYGGDQAKFQAAAKKLGYTPESLKDFFRLGLMQNKIKAAVDKQVALTPAQLSAAYKKQASAFGDARNVHYVLWPSKAAAQTALAKLNSGTAEAQAVSGAIDADSLHGSAPFTAESAPGLMDSNFQQAAFSLPQGTWAAVPVSKSYAKASLAGKCKPSCYFLINPTGAVAKAGTPAAEKLLHSQILDKLGTSASTAAKETARFTALLAPIKKNIKYASGYAPPAGTAATTG